MDSVVQPRRTSALDKWSFRACLIAICETFLAIILIFVPSLFIKHPLFKYGHPPMTTTKLAIAIPMVFLPLASCTTSFLSLMRHTGLRQIPDHGYIHFGAPTKPSIYLPFQMMQLIASFLVLAHDFVVFSTREVWFWSSLMMGFTPALVGTIYGLVGIVRFFFAASAKLNLRRYRSATTCEEYSDDTIEHSTLEQAYQQQFWNDAAGPNLANTALDQGDIFPLQLRNEEPTDPQPENAQNLGDNSTAQEIDTSDVSTQVDETRSQHSAWPANKPRFRWQEQAGVRNNGREFWRPYVRTITLMVAWNQGYKMLLQHTSHSPQTLRLLALERFGLTTMTLLASVFLAISLRKSRFVLIFAAFCFTITASVTWFAEFVYRVWSFFYNMRQFSSGLNFMSFLMVLLSLVVTRDFVALMRCSIKMEWIPGYSSLAREYELWKERRNWLGTEIEEAEDENT